ncbi:hypothetical protein WDU94_009828 [Cyamophila willieti]
MDVPIFTHLLPSQAVLDAGVGVSPTPRRPPYGLSHGQDIFIYYLFKLYWTLGSACLRLQAFPLRSVAWKRYIHSLPFQAVLDAGVGVSPTPGVPSAVCHMDKIYSFTTFSSRTGRWGRRVSDSRRPLYGLSHGQCIFIHSLPSQAVLDAGVGVSPTPRRPLYGLSHGQDIFIHYLLKPYWTLGSACLRLQASPLRSVTWTRYIHSLPSQAVLDAGVGVSPTPRRPLYGLSHGQDIFIHYLLKPYWTLGSACLRLQASPLRSVTWTRYIHSLPSQAVLDAGVGVSPTPRRPLYGLSHGQDIFIHYLFKLYWTLGSACLRLPGVPSTVCRMDKVYSFTTFSSRTGRWGRRVSDSRRSLCGLSHGINNGYDLESGSQFHGHVLHEVLRFEQHESLAVYLLHGEVFHIFRVA